LWLLKVSAETFILTVIVVVLRLRETLIPKAVVEAGCAGFPLKHKELVKMAMNNKEGEQCECALITSLDFCNDIPK